MPEKIYYNTKDAAAKLGLKTVSIRSAIWRGRLPAEKNGRDWLIKVGDLEAFSAMERRPGRPKSSSV